MQFLVLQSSGHTRTERKELSPRMPVMLALTEGRVLVGQLVCKWPFVSDVIA